MSYLRIISCIEWRTIIYRYITGGLGPGSDLVLYKLFDHILNPVHYIWIFKKKNYLNQLIYIFVDELV